MEKAEALELIGRKIVPTLEEFGIEGFVITGYIKCDGDRVERFTACCTPKKNAAIEDGLGKLAIFSSMWAASQPSQVPPGADDQRG